MRTILNNCRLIPELSDGKDFQHAEVILSEGIISEVNSEPSHCGVSDDLDIEIDCEGKTLLPGLFDIHTHLNWDYQNGMRKINDFSLFTNSCLSARRFLGLGITTIRDMGSPKRVSVYVRDAINRGLFTGPRIISGGIILRPVVGEEPASPYNFLRYVSGSEGYSRAAKEEIGSGADFVKLYAPGDPSELLPEELVAVVRIAHMRKRRVAVHAHDAGAISMCLDAGVDTIEHASFIRDEDIQRLKTVKTYLVPTLTVLSDKVKTPGFTPEQKKEMLKPLLDANAKNISNAYHAGLMLGFGTDTPSEEQERVPGLEFLMRREYCGMSNIDMLLQATYFSAKICGLENVTGRIKTGLAADVILVDGMPDKDISAMFKKPKMVFIGGRRYETQCY